MNDETTPSYHNAEPFRLAFEDSPVSADFVVYYGEPQPSCSLWYVPGTWQDD